MSVFPENGNMQVTFNWHQEVHGYSEYTEDLVAKAEEVCLKFLQKKARVPLPLDMSRGICCCSC